MDEPLRKAISAASLPMLTDAGAEAASCNEGNRPAKARSEPSTKAVLSLAQALATSGTLEDAVYTAAADALTRRGAALDAAEVSGAPQAWRSWKDQSRPHVLSEQPDICILWKPAGWTVSIDSEEDPWGSASLNSSASAGTGGRQLQDWVVAQLGPSFRISVDAGAGYGLVHRLDRDTSGAIVCATSYRGYFLAQLQFATRRVRKDYVALCHGHLLAVPRFLQAPLGGLRQADGSWRSFVDPSGRRALTEICSVGHLVCEEGSHVSLVEVRLHTGRQHQIRAHLAAEGHPLVGDTIYGGHLHRWCSRTFLHAHHISLDVGAGQMASECPLPDDLRGALAALVASDGTETQVGSAAMLDKWLSM